VNDEPHIGTAYTTVAADVLARYHRLKGEPVFFLTGTDEHGQHVANAAARAGVEPQEWADRMVVKFTDVWRKLNISNDFFVRTTSERHGRISRAFVQKLYEQGDVYAGVYEGWYCVPDESFWLPSQLVDGKCPQCGREVELLKEQNYFFRLSKYQERLLEHIEANPDFIQPEIRRNEVLSFIGQGLADQSISRKTLAWGIPLPFDESQVLYVWFDALLNYISSIGFGEEDETFPNVWPADWHLIGKEILRFHAVIWPAMLMAAELPLPRRVFAHGWLTVEGEKMSKSRGNAVSPHVLIEEFGVDAYRYYFMREFSFGTDGNFSHATMFSRYNSELANDLGNLVSRVLAMIDRYRDGVVPGYGTAPSEAAELELDEMVRSAADCLPRLDQAFAGPSFNDALQVIWNLVSAINRHVDQTAAWDLNKDPAKAARLDQVLYCQAEGIRICTILLSPFMPGTAERMWEQLGAAGTLSELRLPESAAWGGLAAGTKVNRGPALFPRLEA
jgi:methionyl-tRNA synthetase